jgi:starch synthase (maltosyl-transferring)
VVRHWISHGVTIFRVDNPHTKPPDFWAWLIGEVKATDPDVLFLSEAFTRPARMDGLAKLGVTQSDSYFTWRTAKWELEEFGPQIA